MILAPAYREDIVDVVRLYIFAQDHARARAFYDRAFGWQLGGEGQRRCWVITASDDPRLGADRGTADRDESRGLSPGIPTVHVADIDAAVTAVLDAGGEVLVPPLRLPGVGRLIYLADTEGNVLGLMQDDPAAA
jgi:predicted enzyme related to lactoylglutathione lyase